MGICFSTPGLVESRGFALSCRFGSRLVLKRWKSKAIRGSDGVVASHELIYIDVISSLSMHRTPSRLSLNSVHSLQLFSARALPKFPLSASFTRLHTRPRLIYKIFCAISFTVGFTPSFRNETKKKIKSPKLSRCCFMTTRMTGNPCPCR